MGDGSAPVGLEEGLIDLSTGDCVLLEMQRELCENDVGARPLAALLDSRGDGGDSSAAVSCEQSRVDQSRWLKTKGCESETSTTTLLCCAVVSGYDDGVAARGGGGRAGAATAAAGAAAGRGRRHQGE